MAKRHALALQIQQGACNPRPITKALLDAIDECRNEGVNPDQDGACFLILHQLAWIMTGQDLGLNHGEDRYSAAWKEVEARVEVKV